MKSLVEAQIRGMVLQGHSASPASYFAFAVTPKRMQLPLVTEKFWVEEAFSAAVFRYFLPLLHFFFF